MRIVLLFALLSLYLSPEIFAQAFKGKVIDATTKEALPFANVVALRATDSVFVSGTVSAEDGTFTLDTPKEQSLIRVSLIGYDTYMEAFRAQEQRVIALSPKQEMLSEVVVTGHAKMFKLENGGITADIQNTPLRTIGNLSEVLGQMPFVNKTENAFTVLGKGTPIVYINNRLVRDNNDLLRIDSRDIKKVTVITNPGAEYDASVNAVIKVETARPVGEGFSMELWTYNRYNSDWYTQDRASLNYRNKGLDLFASFEYANMNFPKDRIWTNEITTDEGTRTVVSDRQDDDKLCFRTPQAGFNYMVNENHSFGARYEYFNTFNSEYDYSIDTRSSLNGKEDEPIHTRSYGDSDGHSHYVNAYYNGKFADWLNLKFDMDYKTSDTDGYDGAIDSAEDKETDRQRTGNNANYDLYAGKLTLESPLAGGNLVYGAEMSHTRNEQRREVKENTGIAGISSSVNNVTQDLYAGFISFNRSFGAFSGNIGLRYENVASEYYQDGKLVAEQSRTHRRLFPNFRIGYNGIKNVNMELAYRNSVSRPSYQTLRSSMSYMGPYTYASGNPLLQPSYTNSLTYTLGWKRFTFMGSYDIVKDYFVEMSELYMKKYVMFTTNNVEKARFLTLALNYNNTFGIWRPNWSIAYEKPYINYGNPKISYNTPICAVNLRNGFSIKKWNFGLDMQMTTKGNSRYYMAYIDKISWSTNVYVNTSFFKERLLVGLHGNDIFATRSDDMSARFNQIKTIWKNNMFRRNVVFSMTYRFNASPKRYKGSNATDEMRRL